MAYRYLGLVREHGVSSTPTLTQAADALLAAQTRAEQQAVLDEQLGKLWLSNPTNRQLAVDVYPLRWLLRLLLRCGQISNDEYLAIVCWARDSDATEGLADLVFAFRDEDVNGQNRAIERAVAAAGRGDLDSFHDTAKRLRTILGLSSSVSVDDSSGQSSLAVDVALAEQHLSDLEELLESAPMDSYRDWQEQFSGSLDSSSAEVVTTRQSEDMGPRPSRLSRSLTVPTFEVVELELDAAFMPTAGATRPKSGASKKADWEQVNQQRLAGGLRAELVVLECEQDLLRRAGRPDLALAVRHVSAEDDTAGYDIESFDSDGTPRHIEVKGTQTYTSQPRIFISMNEVATAAVDPHFRLVLVLGYAERVARIAELELLTTFVRDHLAGHANTAALGFVAAPDGWLIRFRLARSH
jgi:hypothetical protein